MIAGMKWDNPNNACQSLRLLAEAVRKGDVSCHMLTGSEDAVTVRIAKPSRREQRMKDAAKAAAFERELQARHPGVYLRDAKASGGDCMSGLCFT